VRRLLPILGHCDRLDDEAARVAVARLLVVEDSADVCMMLATLCEQWGHEVEAATSGREALASVAEFHPHVVLLDLTLPTETEGLELARRIRATDRSGTYIIALGGWTTPAGRARALIAGANEFLTKPPDLDALRRNVARVVGKRARGRRI
jgi:DNA-binding response OmpR family regulator